VRIGMEYLVTVYTDVELQKYLLQPLLLITADSVTVIPKDGVSCDVCNTKVAVLAGEVDKLPKGYALFVDDELYEVLCEKCRQRYYPTLPVYKRMLTKQW